MFLIHLLHTGKLVGPPQTQCDVHVGFYLEQTWRNTITMAREDFQCMKSDQNALRSLAFIAEEIEPRDPDSGQRSRDNPVERCPRLVD